jgi:hypothetical protein
LSQQFPAYLRRDARRVQSQVLGQTLRTKTIRGGAMRKARDLSKGPIQGAYPGRLPKEPVERTRRKDLSEEKGSAPSQTGTETGQRPKPLTLLFVVANLDSRQVSKEICDTCCWPSARPCLASILRSRASILRSPASSCRCPAKPHRSSASTNPKEQNPPSLAEPESHDPPVALKTEAEPQTETRTKHVNQVAGDVRRWAETKNAGRGGAGT